MAETRYVQAEQATQKDEAMNGICNNKINHSSEYTEQDHLASIISIRKFATPASQTSHKTCRRHGQIHTLSTNSLWTQLSTMKSMPQKTTRHKSHKATDLQKNKQRRQDHVVEE